MSNQLAMYWEGLLQSIVRPIPKWISPNMLSWLRIIMVMPLYVLISKKEFTAACVIFTVAALLDLFDGPLARLRKQITEEGKILDPLADKVMVITALIGFSNLLPHLIVFLLICLEVLLAIVALWKYSRRKRKSRTKKRGSNGFGKTKMATEVIGIYLLFLQIPALAEIPTMLIGLSIPLAIFSLIGHLTINSVHNGQNK